MRYLPVILKPEPVFIFVMAFMKRTASGRETEVMDAGAATSHRVPAEEGGAETIAATADERTAALAPKDCVLHGPA